MNPYLVQGPAQISFSGGRSSAMMLVKIVEAHGGTLPTDVIVGFANTGKELEETLLFVDRVHNFLGIDLRWVEYNENARWSPVNFVTASRNGGPFASVMRHRGYVPNPMTRICTQYLKVIPLHELMKSFKLDAFSTVSGIRADEPRRAAKIRARGDFVLPLVDAGVTTADVIAYWKSMPFDLELPPDGAHSNCDLCFLKGTNRLLGLIREEPARADWWIKQEAGGKLFRIDRPNYAALKVIATQPQLFDAEESEDQQPCECTD